MLIWVFVSKVQLLFTLKPLGTQNNCGRADSYQNLIRSGGRSPKSLVNTGFFGFFNLFPLDKFKYMKLHLVCFRKQNIRKIVNILPVIFGC